MPDGWRIYEGGGGVKEAVKVLERGVAAHPYAPVLRAMLAFHYLRLNQNQRAREVMEQHMELFPEDSLMRGRQEKVEGLEP